MNCGFRGHRSFWGAANRGFRERRPFEKRNHELWFWRTPRVKLFGRENSASCVVRECFFFFFLGEDIANCQVGMEMELSQRTF